MKSAPRILAVAAAIFLAGLFIFPMWQITLYAPQYPKGVAMHIWINKIGGDSPGVLQNVNILNHYVGMKEIVPDAIPELQYFPYVIMGLIAFAFFAAMANNRKVYLTWALLFGILAVLGIYDFYLWEYDYGHDLSETAPIKIPGANFQPPLLGSKTILNFIAESYPATGGILAGISMFFGWCAWWLKLKMDKKDEKNYATSGLAYSTK